MSLRSFSPIPRFCDNVFFLFFPFDFFPFLDPSSIFFFSFSRSFEHIVAFAASDFVAMLSHHEAECDIRAVSPGALKPNSSAEFVGRIRPRSVP